MPETFIFNENRTTFLQYGIKLLLVIALKSMKNMLQDVVPLTIQEPAFADNCDRSKQINSGTVPQTLGPIHLGNNDFIEKGPDEYTNIVAFKGLERWAIGKQELKVPSFLA